MKLIITGCGSIGRRHAKNARKLGAEVVLCDINQDRALELATEIGAAEMFTNYEDAARSSGADAAVVSTPSHLHTAPAHAFLNAGMHVLMEKPLCTSMSNAIGLKEHVDKCGRVFMMAHTYRFRSEWQAVKKMLEEQPVGKVLSAEFMGGWYLPDWHFREDYRLEYAAQQQQGGGVLLTSMSHFFDVVSWLFGDIDRITGAKMRISQLDINVDDAVMCAVRTQRGIGVTLYEDFISRCPRRTLRVNGELGYVEADFNRKLLSIWDARIKRYVPQSQSEIDQNSLFRILEDGIGYDMAPDVLPMQYSGNDAYLAELQHFLDLISSERTEHDLSIDAGIKVLQAIQSSELSDWSMEKAT